MTTVELADSRWPVANCDAAECRAPIVWAITEKAKRMPVDLEPSAGGNIVLRDTGGTAPLAVVLAPSQAFRRRNLRTSHFATCPAAPSFRKRRPK
jgi:hypothetical protein